MGELFYFVFGLLLLVGVVAVPILLIVSLSRIRRLEQRITSIELGARRAQPPTEASPVARQEAPRSASHSSREEDWSSGEPTSSQIAPQPAQPEPTQRTAEPSAETHPRIPQRPQAPPEAPAAPLPPAPRELQKAASRSEPQPLPPLTQSRPTREPIRWEEWIGVRGAAILGGAILALAGIFLFRHALQEGWIGPKARVLLGAGAGALCILVAQLLRRKKYGFAPSALEGGGLVALYASTWAADRLYDLIPHWVSFSSMAAITGLACFLALRSNALLTAVIGLFGGFATPLLLSSTLEDPVQLFGYIAVLDVALLALGSKRRWPSLGLLALFGTFLVQAFWMLRHMGSAGVAIGALIVGLFALLFALSGKWLGGTEESRGQTSLQAMAILFPFLFAVYFASSFQLGDAEDFYSTAGLLVLLQTAACVLAARKDSSWLPVASSAGAMGVTGIVWLRQLQSSVGVPGWLICGVVAVLLLIPLAFAEVRRLQRSSPSEPKTRRHDWTTGGAGGLLVGTVLALLFCGASLVLADRVQADSQHLAILALLSALGLYALRRGLHETLLGALALGLGIAMALRHGLTLGGLDGAANVLIGPVAKLQGLILLAPAALYLAFAWRESDDERNGFLWSPVAYLAPVLVVLPLTFVPADQILVDWWPRATILLAGVLLSLTATRARSWPLFASSAAACWCLLAYWTITSRGSESPNSDLLYIGLAALLFSLWPLVRLRNRPAPAGIWLASSGVVPFFALAAIQSFRRLEHEHPITSAAMFGIALVLPSLLCAALRARQDDRGAGAQRALPWICASLTLLAAVAISARIDIEPRSTTLALWALGLAVVRRTVPHSAGVQFGTAATMSLASALLVLRLGESRVFLRSDSFVLNSFSFAYLIPAAAGVIGSTLLFRAAEREGRMSTEFKLGAAIPALWAVLLVFLWINLAIWNQFETFEYLTIRTERIQKRDLTLSIAWAVYALLLLGLGTYIRAGALRWTSLLVLLAAIAKAFLWDLGELDSLYRVGSLAGLAVSLILVSLFYQRFVFGKREEGPALSAPGTEPPSPPEEGA